MANDTSPDPPTDIDDYVAYADDPDETATDPAPEGARLVGAGVSCETCAHRHVCTLLSGIAPMLDNWQGQQSDAEPPIDLHDLAVICDAFMHEDDAPEMDVNQ